MTYGPNKTVANFRRAAPMTARSAAPKSANSDAIAAIVEQMRAGRITAQEAGKMVEALTK